MLSNSTIPAKRHNLFILAFKHLPTGLLATAIGIAALSAPFLYNLFRSHGVDSFIGGALATGAVILVVPSLLLYFITLLRSPRIRTRVETEAERELEIISKDLQTLEEKEKKEEKQVHHLEEVVKGDMKEREEKDRKENERWGLLTESLQLQKETGELAAEERILVAEQVKEIKEEGEVALKEYATDDIKARETKERTDEEHWASLDERMRIQEEKNDLREKKQEIREEEFLRMKQNEESKKK
jgi:hypothetical protein